MKTRNDMIRELHDHIVCGQVDLEELVAQGDIKPQRAKDPRHDLFQKIKYPGKEFYKGGWGPEPLVYDTQGDPYRGRVGRIHCSYLRYKEIAEWFLTVRFKEHDHAQRG